MDLQSRQLFRVRPSEDSSRRRTFRMDSIWLSLMVRRLGVCCAPVVTCVVVKVGVISSSFVSSMFSVLLWLEGRILMAREGNISMSSTLCGSRHELPTLGEKFWRVGPQRTEFEILHYPQNSGGQSVKEVIVCTK